MFKLFKRKPKPKTFWLSLQSAVTMPTCPLHGDKCGSFQMPDGVWVTDYRPCPALEGAIERAEWNQTHEYVWNVATEEWLVIDR
jgi:hypothetical protein